MLRAIFKHFGWGKKNENLLEQFGIRKSPRIFTGEETLEEFIAKLMDNSVEDIDYDLRRRTHSAQYPPEFITKYFLPIKQKAEDEPYKSADLMLRLAARESTKLRERELVDYRGQINKEGSFASIIIPDPENPEESFIVKIRRSVGTGPGYGSLGGFLESTDGRDKRPAREWDEEIGELIDGQIAQSTSEEEIANLNALKTRMASLKKHIEYLPLFTAHDDAHVIERGWGFKVDAHAHIASMSKEHQEEALALFRDLAKLDAKGEEVDGVEIKPIKDLPAIVFDSHYGHEAYADIIAAQVVLSRATRNKQPIGGLNLWEYVAQKSPEAVRRISEKMRLGLNILEANFLDLAKDFLEGRHAKPGDLPIQGFAIEHYEDTYHHGIDVKNLRRARAVIRLENVDFSLGAPVTSKSARFVMPVPKDAKDKLVEMEPPPSVTVYEETVGKKTRRYYRDNGGERHYIGEPLKGFGKKDVGVLFWNEVEEMYQGASSVRTGDEQNVVMINNLNDMQLSYLHNELFRLTKGHPEKLDSADFDVMMAKIKTKEFRRMGLQEGDTPEEIPTYYSDVGYIKQNFVESASLYGVKNRKADVKRAVYIHGPTIVTGIPDRPPLPVGEEGGIIVSLGNGEYSVISADSPGLEEYHVVMGDGQSYPIDVEKLAWEGRIAPAGIETKPEIVFTADDLLDKPYIEVMTNPDPIANGRVLAKFSLIDEPRFQPTPEPVREEKSVDAKTMKETTLPRMAGITRVEYDDAGKLVAVHYQNPTDGSFNEWTNQVFRAGSDDGLPLDCLILPTQNSPKLRQKICNAIEGICQGQERVTLTQFDQILKAIYALHRENGSDPDMYNGPLAKNMAANANVPLDDKGNVAESGQAVYAWGGGYTKAGQHKVAFIIEAEIDQPTRFYGVGNGLPPDGQVGQGPIAVSGRTAKMVVAADVDADTGEIRFEEARKLDINYAQNDLLGRDGSSLDFSTSGLNNMRLQGKLIGAGDFVLKLTPQQRIKRGYRPKKKQGAEATGGS